MDDAQEYQTTPPRVWDELEARRLEVWIEQARKGWHEDHAVVGDSVVAHARRVAGIDSGHWCEALPEQKEAARRFLIALYGSTLDVTTQTGSLS